MGLAKRIAAVGARGIRPRSAGSAVLGSRTDFGVTFELKHYFFDREAVLKMVDKQTAGALSKVGAYVRQRARSIQRRRKGPSAPGTPPSVHSKSAYATLRNIWFGLNPTTRKSVIVGPVLLNSAFKLSITVPEIQEFGGVKPITEYQYMQNGQPISPWRVAVGSPKQPGITIRSRIRLANYPARPYMSTALQLEQQDGTIAKAFKETIVFQGGISARGKRVA